MSTQKIQVNPQAKELLPSMDQALEENLETNNGHIFSIRKSTIKLQKKKKKKKTVFEDLKRHVHGLIKV